jgi:hypothetical protein
MHCPEHIVFDRWIGDRWYVALTLYWRDVPRRLIPWSVWLNPLRYELRLTDSKWQRRRSINTNGRAAYLWANFWLRVRERFN